jgi:hypothetical protein
VQQAVLPNTEEGQGWPTDQPEALLVVDESGTVVCDTCDTEGTACPHVSLALAALMVQLPAELLAHAIVSPLAH